MSTRRKDKERSIKHFLLHTNSAREQDRGEGYTLFLRRDERRRLKRFPLASLSLSLSLIVNFWGVRCGGGWQQAKKAKCTLPEEEMLQFENNVET